MSPPTFFGGRESAREGIRARTSGLEATNRCPSQNVR
jgi:hypothetical protein